MNESKNNSIMNSLHYILILVGVLALVLSYFLVYSKYSDKLDTIKGEIKTLKEQRDDLETKDKNSAKVLAKTEDNKLEIEKRFKEFNGNLSCQNEIMDAYNITQKYPDVQVGALSMDDVTPGYEFGQVGNSAGALSDYTAEYMKYTIKTGSSSDKIAEILRDIRDEEHTRKVFGGISISVDVDKNLVVMETTVFEHAVLGADRTFYEQTIPDYLKGREDIFLNSVIDSIK